KVIKPALANGKVVLCDRYIDSTLAYQLGGRGLPEDLVRYINWISSRGIIPDLTILLDIPAKKGLERAKKRGAVNRFENEILAFHERVREKYEELEENDQKRIKKINAQMPIEEVAEKIKLLVTEIIK
ncbi:dTMP kinase, partial [candidate division WOR-1 bacterium RIFOXYD2_FULL_36_8]